jgi:hypothetical protein
MAIPPEAREESAMDNYEDACRRAATDQDLDPLTSAVDARRADLERAGVTYEVEQTGGFTMVATFYIGDEATGDAVTCTNEDTWIVVCQPTEYWLEGGGDYYDDPRVEDWSLECKTPAAIVDRVLTRAQGVPAVGERRTFHRSPVG